MSTVSDDRYVDLRVDDHAKPIEELKRIYTLYENTFLHWTPVYIGT